MIKTIKTLSLAASVAVITSPAFAQQAIGDMSKGIMNRLDGVVDLTFLLSMIGGGVLSVIGLMKLKAASDNPQQTKYSDGLIRIAIGAALMAPGTVSQVAQMTATGEDINANVTKSQDFKNQLNNFN